jgi:hypothetical protein
MLKPKTAYDLIYNYIEYGFISTETIIDCFWIREDRQKEISEKLENIKTEWFNARLDYSEWRWDRTQPLYADPFIEKACKILETYCDLNYILP